MMLPRNVKKPPQQHLKKSKASTKQISDKGLELPICLML
jgi:hypothetical protein